MTPATTIQTEGAELPEMPTVARLPGVVIRPFRDASDFERIAKVIRESNRADEIPWLPTVDNLRADLANRESIDPARDVILAELGDMPIAFTGVERVVRDGSPVYEMWSSVLPPFRRQGLGTALLGWCFARIRQRAAVEDPGLPIIVQTDAEDQETGHRALLALAGFTPVRHFFLMRRPTLDNVPDVPLPEGLEVRPVTEEQRRPILEAEFEAFLDHWGSRERSEEHFTMTLSRAELDTDLWVVAWDGDQIAGVVENWIWPDENAELGVKRGWLERISVRRPWRRRGLARALTARSLVKLREAGMEDGMLGVDSENANGAFGLYEGLGFEIHSRSAAYRRTLDEAS
jgi:mycothiol synthase